MEYTILNKKMDQRVDVVVPIVWSIFGNSILTGPCGFPQRIGTTAPPIRPSLLGGPQVGSLAEIAAVQNPRFSKDITVKPEFLPQPIFPSSDESDAALSSPVEANSSNSAQSLKSSSTIAKTSHKKKTSSASRKSQIKKSLSHNAISAIEDASSKDGNVRDSSKEVASLFSSPTTPTFQQNLPLSRQPDGSAHAVQATNPTQILPSSASISTWAPKKINKKDTTKTTFQDVPTTFKELISNASTCLGGHIARRLVEVGITDIFTVPGDFNLVLLDRLVAHPGLNNIGCCNEINAGYAADGYARCRGVGACVTSTVGGLSVINAIAGSYSENLPIICLVGGPNTNDYGINRLQHHTIGIPNFSKEATCFRQVTCYQAIIMCIEDAHELVDRAISTALRESKPVYISVSCNLAGLSHPSFSHELVPFAMVFKCRTSNMVCLQAAVAATLKKLESATKPVLIGGPKLRVAKANEAFSAFAKASGFAVATMPSAKGQVSEYLSRFIGTYWGPISSPFCMEIVESSDCYIFAGPIFNDYSSAGYSLLLKKTNMIILEPHMVIVGDSEEFGCVQMDDFLHKLAKEVVMNTNSYDNYTRIFVKEGEVPRIEATDNALQVNMLFKYLQGMLTSDSTLIVETGDSWFNCQKLKLPDGCGYEFQMHYSSTGWSVGALLGYAQGTNKRCIACIGDGSFQMSAQDLSTMIRNQQNNIIFLLNNGGYTTDIAIHDGPYNVIKNWNYIGVVEAFCNGVGALWTKKVTNEEELALAVKTAQEKINMLCFIEIVCHKYDTSKELLEWGSRVSATNSRPFQYDH